MLFGWSLSTTVGVTYMFLQCLTLVFLSVGGFCFVQKQFRIYKQQSQSQSSLSSSNDNDNTDNTDVAMANAMTQKKNKSFCKMWIKTVWKMRSVYSSFLVHSFDIATDLIVILDWFNESDQEHIDSKLMGYLSIGVIAFHKIISSFAIWIVEKNLLRTILQFCDLLIFQEIYYAHNKIVTSLRNKKSGNTSDQKEAIESTMTFKYIRSLEATYESMPQAVLQLIYLMRTAAFGESNSVVIGLSILQSLISMTNSILKDDNSRGMQGNKWKKYKKRLPPSIPFLKHGLSRASQVISRVAIMSLFWTVVGGLAFGFMALFELLCLLGASGVVMSKITSFSVENTFLLISGLILLPPELMFSDSFEKYGISNDDLFCPWTNVGEWSDYSDMAILCCVNYFGCVGLGKLLGKMWIFCSRTDNQVEYVWPSARLGISFIEIAIIIIVGILNIDNPNQVNYLFDLKHGFAVFIVMIVAFLIDCGYLVLFPTFSLPLSANPRSKWGFAMAGELTQLQKLNLIDLRRKEDQVTITHNSYAESHELTVATYNPETESKSQSQSQQRRYEEQIISAFWDEACPKTALKDDNRQVDSLITDYFAATVFNEYLKDRFSPRIKAMVSSGQCDRFLSKFPITFGIVALAYCSKKIYGKETARHSVFNDDKKIAEKILKLQWIDMDLLKKIEKPGQMITEFITLANIKGDRLASVTLMDRLKSDTAILKRDKILPITIATFALANNHIEIVKWLESKGAIKHKMYNNNSELATAAIYNCDFPIEDNSYWKLAYDGKLSQLENNVLVRNGIDFDETYDSILLDKNVGDKMRNHMESRFERLTCRLIAEARGHYDVVNWLVSQGAKFGFVDTEAHSIVKKYYVDYKDDFTFDENDNKDEHDNILNYIDISKAEKYSLCYHGDLETLKLKYSDYEGNKEFWNEYFVPWKVYPVTLAAFALYGKKNVLVSWLEARGAKKHKYLVGQDVTVLQRLMVSEVTDIGTHGTDAGKPINIGGEKWLWAWKGNEEAIDNLNIWDKQFDRREYVNSFQATSAMFALANKQYDIVDWLESQGAKKHLFLNRNVKYAREIIDPFYDAWID